MSQDTETVVGTIRDYLTANDLEFTEEDGRFSLALPGERAPGGRGAAECRWGRGGRWARHGRTWRWPVTWAPGWGAMPATGDGHR